MMTHQEETAIAVLIASSLVLAIVWFVVAKTEHEYGNWEYFTKSIRSWMVWATLSWWVFTIFYTLKIIYKYQ